LGRHSKPSRLALSLGVPVVAAPALAGVAATFFMSPQALADPSVAGASTSHSVTADVKSPVGPSTQLLAAVAQSASQQAASKPATYTVKLGDSLSVIAGREYHSQAAWPVLYWANHSAIKWANDIEPGQVLKVPAKPAKIPSPPGQLGPAPAGSAVTVSASTVSASTVSASTVSASTVSASTAAAAQTVSTASTYTGGTPGGSFGACVIARESGGNAQVMNSTGHYGLYQFSASTWAAYGGNPADFGSASVSEQNQVFANALAAGGQSNWAPYDGC
jgi:LysM repeat protein